MGLLIRFTSESAVLSTPYLMVYRYLETEFAYFRANPDLDEYHAGVVARLCKYALEVAPKEDNLLRPVLVHRELHMINIMVHNAKISAVLDWDASCFGQEQLHAYLATQSHAALPRCLAAGYPDFLRFDRCYDPQYELHPRIMPTKEA
jgi:hypothetical protein